MSAPRHQRAAAHLLLLTGFVAGPPAYALDVICARVKIQIEQKLTLERQGFDAMMRITNALDTVELKQVRVDVLFTDDAGNPVLATSDPNNTSAAFFIRVDTLGGITDVSGNGTVAPSSAAEIHWLIVPSPGAGGTVPGGKLYFVGANLSYTVGGEPQTIKVSPDTITVQPMPRLTLDYFLTKDVFADDPLTTPIEPTVPFTLGVRVKNGGAAAARNVRIESAQPKIVENNQGLLIGFQITGSYVNDAPTNPSLLASLGDIAPTSAGTARWVMTSSLSGKFVEFKATFTHSAALGGALTSLIDATNTHLLVRDVRVDLPGRDNVRDFLAADDDVLRVYESTGVDTTVTNQSASSSLAPFGASYRLSAPTTAGFMYVQLPDPYGGTKQLGAVTRADGKVIPPENVWLSKSRPTPTAPFNYWLNLFDANTAGAYTVTPIDPPVGPHPPVLQFIPDFIVREGSRVGFIVEASDPDGTVPTLSTSQLPTGAQFTQQAPSNGLARGSFEWTPATGQAGQYPITFTASDGALTTSRTPTITVTTLAPPAGPDTPVISRPAVASTVTALQPELAVAPSTNPLDTAASDLFELYRDAAYTDRIAQSAAVPRTALGAAWRVPSPLADNATYYWRVRAFDGTTYSTWTLGRFTVNTANDAPTVPAIAAPSPGARVDTTSPALAVANSADPDGEPVVYRFEVYSDAALTQKIRELPNVAPGAGGVTSVTVTPALADQATYHWRAFAIDPHGALTASPAASFLVDVNHPAPGAPAILSPVAGTPVSSASVPLKVTNGSHAPGATVSYLFELDRDPSFSSATIVRSGPVPEGQGGSTTFTVTGLLENARYSWRVKISDGQAESAWVYGDFLVDQANDPPATPAPLNPGHGAFVSTTEPLLEIGPSTDPEGDSVVYRLEIYSDDSLSTRVAEKLTNTLTWLVQPPLGDDATYFWRARAEDTRGGASAWSAVQRFSVHTGTVRPPGLVVVEPAGVVTVTGPTVPIAWEIDDPTHASTLSLYWDHDALGEDGTLIARDLAQDPTTNTGRYTWNVSALLPGTYSVYASATNRAGTTTRYAAGAYVVPVPQPRGGVTITPTTALETTETGGTATFTVALTIAPRSDVTIGLTVSRPGEASLAPSSLTFTPSNWNAARPVTVTGLPDCVDDGDQAYQVVPGRAASADPDYNGIQGAALSLVNRGSTQGCAANQPPQANAGPDQAIDSGSAVVLPGSGTDSDGTVAAYRWAQTAGPAVTLSNANAATAGFTAPSPSADTPLTLELTVTDNEGATGRDSVTVTVRARPNQPPVASAGADRTVTAGALVTLAGSGTDADGTIAAYEWSQVSGPSVALSDAASATATFTAPPVNAPAALGFTLTVTDDRGARGTDSVIVTVQPILNQPPTANAGPDQTAISGAAVTLTGNATDPDGTVASYLWTQTAGPAVALSGASTATARFTAPPVSAGTVLAFQLTATDNQGATAADTVAVTVVPNQLPAVGAGADQVVNEGTLVTLVGAASDPDGTITSVHWAQTEGPAVTLTSPNVLTATCTAPAVSADTVLTFTLTATDNLGAANSATTHVTVHHVNQPPTANAGPNQTVNESVLVTLTGAGFDPDGTIVSYAWVQTTGRPVALANVGTQVATFTSPQVNSPSTLTFQLTVTDDEGATGTARVNIRVRNNIQNALPSVNAGPRQTVDEGTPVTLTGSATDSNGTIASLQWTQTKGPVVALSGAQSVVAHFTAPQVSARTVLKFRLTATDNGGASASDGTEVAVRNAPDAPVVNAGPDLAVNEGARITIRGSANRSGVSYQWTRISGPAVTLSDANKATVSFIAPTVTADTVLTLQLKASGKKGAAGADTVNIVIRNVNQPPVLKVEKVGKIDERSLVKLSARGSKDPDGRIRSYLWVQTSGPAVALLHPRSATPSFTAPEVTRETALAFRVTVTDNERARSNALVKVTVRNVRRK